VRRSEGINEPRSEEGTREVGRWPQDETLCERVDELLRSHKRELLLSTTGSRALIEELAERSKGLEEAIREIALEVQEAIASKMHTRGASCSEAAADASTPSPRSRPRARRPAD